MIRVDTRMNIKEWNKQRARFAESRAVAVVASPIVPIVPIFPMSLCPLYSLNIYLPFSQFSLILP